jgi:fibronectin-binding autotransporter adhesin
LTAVSSSAPVVSGSWTTGSTLTTTNGVWTSSGTFTYQWQRSTDNSTWSSITGATSSSYVLTSADATPPAYVRVQVYLTGASNADGVAYSVATAKVGAPYNTAAPAISGSLRVGVALTSSDGTWTGSPTFAYQWQTSSDGIAWANIDGATSSTYTPTYTIANLRLRVSVSGVNATDTATVTSQVVQGFLAPVASAIPSISGTVQSGSTLTTTSGTWPSTSSGYVYSWHRSSDGGVTWTDIAGQTSTTYVLVAADVGYRIRSQVTISTNAGSSTAYSLPTVAVAPAP